MGKTLEDRVLACCRRRRLVRPGGRLLAAVSGGPDSVCLLRVLYNLRAQLGVSLHAAHLNHGLRGEDADADALYVKNLCAQMGIPATIEKVYVKDYQAANRLSPEEAAREVRYRFLAETAASIGADRVAVGHTAGDQVETVLLHLIRGCGTAGMRGLKAKGKWRSRYGGAGLTVIRPLLETGREETAAYCREHNLKPRQDNSNLDTDIPRNRIRRELLPLLREYNPQVDNAVNRLADIAAADWRFLEAASATLWRELATATKNSVSFKREGLLAQPPAARRLLLRRALEELRGSLMDIEVRHIAGMMRLLKKPAGKQIDLPGGLVFAAGYDHYRLGLAAEAPPAPALPGETALNIPGETALPGWRVQAETGAPGAAAESGDANTALLDKDKCGDRLVVRPRRRGDRFMPLGMQGTKKVSDFMIDARIPQAQRDLVPLVCDEKGILWLAGHRLDERVRVSETTRRVLRLRFIPQAV